MTTKCILLSLGLMMGVLFAQETLTPQEAADFFYQRFGDKNYPHKKVNHTKGFCIAGHFDPRKDIDEFVKIPLLNTKSKVVARFSTGGGNPNASDRFSVHGLALKLTNGKDYWDLAMLNTVINAGKTPDVIVEFLKAVSDPDKKNLEVLAGKYPSVRRFLDYGKTLGVPLSLANVQFNTQHVYKILGADAKIMNAKIIFVPHAGIIELSDKEAKKAGDNFLEKRFQEDLKKGSVKYYMYLVLANPKDVLDDISIPWENTNRKIFLGTLELDKFKGNSCNLDVFLPGILPEGVQAPIDPVFEFRNQVYGITHQRRQ
ncbi:hypothetical protein BKH41_07590 [Helicobacter sp. 12S02232-10]|uniref:catalase n=1 Tax=Helicobacter sp. 12S02232-10 TaxID=1476197 RepID=UPI000BA7A2B1|nr:catalase [Helicobacter sp. 12S02232-10]PAF47435.1 hypothetical protein BKH41_07590 [Helicobacter sp. 12S02232-10]